MRLIVKYLAALVLFVFSGLISAGPHYLTGEITNFTSSSAGISIMLSTGVPDNCEGVSYNWMTIRKEDTAMITLTLSMYHAGIKKVTVYTEDKNNNNGRCFINQVDPSENS